MSEETKTIWVAYLSPSCIVAQTSKLSDAFEEYVPKSTTVPRDVVDELAGNLEHIKSLIETALYGDFISNSQYRRGGGIDDLVPEPAEALGSLLNAISCVEEAQASLQTGDNDE